MTMNEKEILQGKGDDRSHESNISNRNVNERTMDLEPRVNRIDSQRKQNSYKESLYRRGDDSSSEQPNIPVRKYNTSETSPSNSKMIGAISIQPSRDTKQENLKKFDGSDEKSSYSKSSFPSSSDQTIQSSSSHSSRSSMYTTPSDHSTSTSTAPSMVPLVRSNDRQTSIYDNMERLQPQRSMVKIRPTDTSEPLPGAWLHRGTSSGRVDNDNLTPDLANGVEEILLDSSYNAAELPPDLHFNISAGMQPPPTHHNDARNSNGEASCASGTNFMNSSQQTFGTENVSYIRCELEENKPTRSRNCKLYAICSLILLAIITSLGIGFGIHSSMNMPSGSSISTTECSMDPIVEACSASYDTIEISDCIKDRITKLQETFEFRFQDERNSSSTCNPENLAIMSVALQLTDGMSNHSVFQRYGLSLLYFATQGYNWITDENWLSDKGLCDWKNINCSISHDDVIGMNLGKNNLQGSIPSLFLNYLPSLQYLDLSDNSLKGTIPSNVYKLKELILNQNELTGMLPLSLIHSRSIESLSLQDNVALILPRQGHFFSGPSWREIFLGKVIINSTFPRGLNLLPNLEVLDMTKTSLRGEMPSEIGLLSKLLKFTASYNSLTGQLPTELGWMKNMKQIDISHNKLNGTIPSQIGYLMNLEKLQMDNNLMVGTLPWELSKNTKLIDFMISSNMISGEMPKEFGQLSNLSYFLFVPNRFTGEIPLEVCNLKNKISEFGDESETECPDFGDLKCPEGLSTCCCDIS